MFAYILSTLKMARIYEIQYFIWIHLKNIPLGLKNFKKIVNAELISVIIIFTNVSQTINKIKYYYLFYKINIYKLEVLVNEDWIHIQNSKSHNC